MTYFLNYQKILKRIEQKNKAKDKKIKNGLIDEIYLLDGGYIRVYTPDMVYLENLRVNSSLYN